MTEMNDDLFAQLEACLGDAGMNEAWNDAPAESGSIYDPPPEGEYDAYVHRFEFISWEAKNDKPAGIALKVEYQVTNSAAYAGKIVSDLLNLSDPERLKWLKGWLWRFEDYLRAKGVEVSEIKLMDLRPVASGDGILDKLLDASVVIFVKHNGKYVNTYLRQVIDGGWQKTPESDVTTQASLDGFAPPPAASAVTGVKDDDIPF